jgi:hypothetical protein
VFYSNITTNDGYIKKMSRFGYDKAKLVREMALVDDVRKANQQQEKKKGEARAATKKRDEKYRELQTWFSEFKQISFIIFQDDRQKLEQLGFSGQQ